jgi:RNA polymerase sigma-70 factor (ECF subfamily)
VPDLPPQPPRPPPLAPDPTLAPRDQERAVVARLKAGDRSAAAELYRWYGDRLYRTAILPRLPVPELAEDVLKDTFRVTLERIDQYRDEDRSIYFWMRRVAINRAIDVHRARQRREGFEGRTTPEETADRTMASPPPAPDRGSELAETRALVELALERLNPRYAQALRLRLLEDRERDECARIMDVSVGNFDVILHRACKAFRGGYPPT